MHARWLALLLAVAGCGRSSLIGSSQSDCPPELINADGTCGRDGGRRDGGPDMKLPCPGDDLCIGSCGARPGCCSCEVCTGNPLCKPIDMGDMGDMGDGGDMIDLCADKNNCKLPACVGDPRCHKLGTEICNNCVDDNDDGLIDCDDPQCFNFRGCQKGHTCDPTNVDCTDPKCACGPLCKDLQCHPTVDFGTLNPTGSTSTRMLNTKGTTDVTKTPCAPGGAGMVVGKFVLTGAASVVLSFTEGAGEDHVFGIFYAGTNQTCGANPIDNACYDPKSATSGKHTYIINAPGEYYVITQPYEPAGQGPVTVTLSTGCSPSEICNNGVDDNCDGLIDCNDPQCVTAPNCVKQECKPDFNVGALVVDGPAHSVSFNTTSADVENNVTCEAAEGGKDVVVRFTLKEMAGVLLQWDQSGDHVVGLFRQPQPGEPCDFDQISCYDPSQRTQDEVAWTDLPPGDYVFVFKATKAGAEGHIDANISAFKNRTLCRNPEDCANPACFGVNGCTGPYCMPDVQLGQLQIGESRTVRLDTTTGILGYKTSCARGGGKAKVVQLAIPQAGPGGGVGIGFDCTQTGDHVLDLFAQVAPRQACDADELVCADPNSLPFGCGYEIPNLEPGTYNVIVEAFQAGTEGSVNLTLSVIDDRQLIDCRKPGACSLRYCVTSQYCTQAQCHPDQMIDPLPLTGQNTFRLVQTANNGVHGQVPCATVSGGQGAVIEITLTTTADLKMAWNQIGNHDFALFTDDGNALPCDAGTLTGTCTQSNGMSTGVATFTKVPQGRYYLIVQADQPDGATQYSGSVNIALSGSPSP